MPGEFDKIVSEINARIAQEVKSAVAPFQVQLLALEKQMGDLRKIMEGGMHPVFNVPSPTVTVSNNVPVPKVDIRVDVPKVENMVPVPKVDVKVDAPKESLYTEVEFTRGQNNAITGAKIKRVRS